MAVRVSVLVLLVLIGLAGGVAGAGSSYDYGFDVGTLSRRQGEQITVVSRLPNVNGTTPLRREIRDVRTDPYSWNLLILALDMMAWTSQDDPLSYYQISGGLVPQRPSCLSFGPVNILAGIHGVPIVPYNGVQAVPGGEKAGYCTHSGVLFPTWHRPYLALMEVRGDRCTQFAI